MKKIAIVGTAPSGEYAPFGDRGWKIWGVGSRASYVTRADRWFELHRLDGEEPEFQTNWRKSLKQWFADGTEIMMLYPEPDLGNVTEYPHREIAARFGTYFMTSSFAWMFALAIHEGATDIALYGVDMEYGTEYREQRTGLRHFIDLARVLKLRISRLPTSGIAYEPVPYPMMTDDPLLQKLKWRTGVTDKNLDTYQDSLIRTRQMIASTHAMMDEAEKSRGRKYNADKRIAELGKTLEGLNATAAQLQTDIAKHEGIKSEQGWLKDFLVP